MTFPSRMPFPPVGERRITVIGYPGSVGGANTECWHTVRLWRKHGVDVTMIPTWETSEFWRRKVASIGCRTLEATPKTLVEKIAPGSIVVAFCNGHFLGQAEALQQRGCRTVWIGCMERIALGEEQHYRRGRLFDRYVFQSRHQRDRICRRLEKWGLQSHQVYLIRGAFWLSEWPFRQRTPHERREFILGRVSRSDPHKFARRSWDIYGLIRKRLQEKGIDCRVRVLGFDAKVEQKLGKPPEWIECLPAGAMPVGRFFDSIDAMVQLNGGIGENWPRSGLEAMASGVPIVVPNRWGWREMLRHGETGFLADTESKVVDHTVELATSSNTYKKVADQARKSVRSLSDPRQLWHSWRSLFDSLI